MPAYLDHAASTPMRPEARDAMVAVLDGACGNPSGSHRAAREARRLLDDARDRVAAAVGARPGEVVFTSGGTEADNLAVTGVVGSAGGAPVCSAIEHPAVLRPVLDAGGRLAPVDRTGVVDLAALADVLRERDDVSLVSAMAASNEVGTVQPLDAIAEEVRRSAPGASLHTDAVAAAPWLDLSAVTAVADLVTVSGHKVGGPKGIGALIVRDGTPLRPLLRGGGQEHERRAGTPDVAGAVAFGVAFEATVAARSGTAARVERLRERLVAGLRATVPDHVVVSPADPAARVPGTVMVCFPGVDREALLFLLDDAGIAAAWGSSCASGASEPSHVLAAMGVDEAVARGSLRLSLGWSSTQTDVDEVLRVLPGAVARLRDAAAAVPSPVGGG